MTKEELKEKIKSLGQFPAHRRRRNYQSYWLDGEYVKGSRDTLKRFEAMGIPKDLSGKTVVDLGCQIGAICTEAYLRGAKQVTGVDICSDYIELAMEIAEYNRHIIFYNMRDLDSFLNIESIKDNRFDILFLLSMYRHIKCSFECLLRSLKWKKAYIENNGTYESKKCKEIELILLKLLIERRIRKWERLGIIQDRGIRCLWKLTSD